MTVTPLVKNFQPIENLEARLVESWREVTQATHAFLTLLREFDLRQGWRECGDNEASSSAESHRVLVHVDASALSGQGGEADLPLPTVKRLCCDGGVVPVVEHNGQPLNVGRKQRTVPTAIKRALLVRDRRCTWPGCHHERFLEAHHVHHWADGGETSLTNLTLVCSHHHRLIHEGGFSVQRRADGSCYFARPDGRPVESPSAEDPMEVRELGAAYRPGLRSSSSHV